MNKLRHHWAVAAGQACLALSLFSMTMLYGAGSLAAILYGLVHTEFGRSFTWVHWVIASPMLYMIWLVGFLVGCAFDVRAWRPLFGYRKPRRATNADGVFAAFHLYLTLVLYIRHQMVWSMPLTRSFMFIPGLRHLVLWSYSLGARIGPNSVVTGCFYDPDITEVGDYAIIGVDSVIVGHSFTTNPDGTALLVTAPVKIGERAVVGGNARIDPGVIIGEDAIVEPSSYVSAFTRIGPREVWGGNPARFVRMRLDGPEQAAGMSPHIALEPNGAPETNNAASSIDADEQTLREIVALALDRPLAAVTADLTAAQCAAWDSLGQLGIAAGLQQKFGIVLPATESFRLRSMADLRTLIREADDNGCPDQPRPGSTAGVGPARTAIDDAHEAAPC